MNTHIEVFYKLAPLALLSDLEPNPCQRLLCCREAEGVKAEAVTSSLFVLHRSGSCAEGDCLAAWLSVLMLDGFNSVLISVAHSLSNSYSRDLWECWRQRNLC